MKQKIFKILTGAISSIFLLTLFNFATVKAATQTWTYKDSNDATITVVEEIIDSNQTSGWGAGRNVTRTVTKEYYNYGDTYNQSEIPTNNKIEEYYYDDNGDIITRSGSISLDGQSTDIWDDTSANGGNFNGSTYEYSSSGNSNKFTYTLLQSLPNTSGGLKENVTLEQYLTWAFRFTLVLAGFLAVMMIVIGGVEYIISGANESMRGEAHKRISNAIYGLILALVSYLVLYTINPSLVDFNNNSFFKAKTTTSSNNSNDNNIETNNSDNSSSNVGDINKGVTDVKDLQFDFGNQ